MVTSRVPKFRPPFQLFCLINNITLWRIARCFFCINRSKSYQTTVSMHNCWDRLLSRRRKQIQESATSVLLPACVFVVVTVVERALLHLCLATKLVIIPRTIQRRRCSVFHSVDNLKVRRMSSKVGYIYSKHSVKYCWIVVGGIHKLFFKAELTSFPESCCKYFKVTVSANDSGK